ncbi:aminopeptidase N [Shewanella sp. Actino-trap-3]|uniref:aminopeptidase N n=1 Tax=Shewanella sp. Actino-trap-3 TaxID=2058331 RepID=UPI000C32ABDC|nr:aminopeptidase N [Shewanella sp. Actino-trap-3]PKG79979.1 aminopeptidase N [Shewanella sp. Actino-trap-3]
MKLLSTQLFRSLVIKTSLIALCCASVISCSSSPTTSSLQRNGSAYISQGQAQARSSLVSNVQYELTFFLSEHSQFSAKSIAHFDLSSVPKLLTLDLNKVNIKQFFINGIKVYPNYNGAYITLNQSLLTEGSNTIEVEFTREHSTNGEGLHRFVDPVDGKVYLYSHFEPAAAQQMFAVFDQPDLKASYQINVHAPKDWQVISAMRETNVVDQGDSNLWTFPVTPKLSPYNFSMHAGPYHVWEDNSGRYPMRLFSRQSVANQVTPQDWFTYTKQGLDFFDRYFGIAYPFKKYDQVLVPDFLYGAMENAGAITFSEDRFLFNAKMTGEQKERLAGVIMHEMAHQWFGDLVTMKWWNGLWLNESFASFMGTLATSEATEFSHAWRTFYASGKQAAYHQDSLVTTHPIEVPVPTSQNAFDNIDAITYQKGASTIKQLRHLLGEETFRRGVSQYLQQYSYQNAELNDFINSLAKASGRDLRQWTQEWLYAAGVNTIKAQYTCQDKQIDSFALVQTADNSQHPTLREQRVQIGLFTQNRYGLEKQQSIAVTYKGAYTEVEPLIGEACPDLVYPNYQDWGFVKVELDSSSFSTAKQSLGQVSDPLLRSMLWQSMWDSVIDGKTSLDQFINIALINAPLEKDYTILGQVLGNLQRAKNYLDLMAPMHGSYNSRISKALSQMSLRMSMESYRNRDFQRRWFDAYISLSSHGDALKHIQSLLQSKSHIKGLNIDQDIRWAMIRQLNRYDYGDAKALLAQEKHLDQSDSGEKAAIAAEVIRPQSSLKRQWLNTIENNDNMPFSKIRIAMNNLYPAEQKLFSAATADQRFANLALMDDKGPVFMRSFAAQLIPTDCSSVNIDAISYALDTQTGLSQLARRALLETRQQEQRCIKIKQTLK